MTLLLGTAVPAVRTLAGALGAELVTVPLGADDATLESWRATAAGGPPEPQIVVAVLLDEPAAGTVDDLDTTSWEARGEGPITAWMMAMGAAAARCADGGTIVAVVDRPAPLDCIGWAPESAVADAVEALTRSLGRSEGHRGVRVNAVTTPARVTTGEVVQPPPPLRRFPGSLEEDVVGALRLLLSDDAAGLTGHVVHADAGRSWR